MAVLRDFRRIADALERLAAGQTASLQAAKEQAPAVARLDALELDRHQFEAEMEGLLLKAEGKLKAAANAEARERHQREKRDADFDPFPDDRDQVEAFEPGSYAENGEEEEVQPVHMGMETNSKATALRYKFS